jgi:hypothetical protein
MLIALLTVTALIVPATGVVALNQHAVVDATQQSSTVAAVNGTVEDTVALNDSHTTATTRGFATETGLKQSSDDRAAFYQIDGTHLYYYDATTRTAHTVSRPNGQRFLNRELLVGQYAATAESDISDFVQPGSEHVRYTDRGTLAVGTTFGPFAYDLETDTWHSRANATIGGYPTITTDPSAVVTAGGYYVMTANQNLYFAIPDWTNHVVEPPENISAVRGEEYVSTEARVAAYEPRVSKTGYPIIFQSVVGLTDQPAETGRPVWNPANSDVVPFAPPDFGPTSVYDGVGSGTVIIAGSDLVAYNVTTGKAEWRLNQTAIETAVRHNNTLYGHNGAINLRTGATMSLYNESATSFHLTELDGERIGGDFSDFQFLTQNGEYAVVKMSGRSKSGKYRSRGVRIVDIETGQIAAQRITTGTHEDRWAPSYRDYRVGAGGDYAVVVSPADIYARDGSSGPAEVIDLRTNETVDELPYAPGRVQQMKVTQDGLVLVPQFPRNNTRIAGERSFGRVKGNYTVYDPEHEEIVGRLPASLRTDESVSAVQVRDGEFYLFKRNNSKTTVTHYGGLDDSLSATASVENGSVAISVAEVSGTPVADATVRLGERRQSTNESGVAVFDSAVSDAGKRSHTLEIQADEMTHRTTVSVTYTRGQDTPTERSQQRGQDTPTERSQQSPDAGSTATSETGAGFGLLTALLVLVAVGIYSRRSGH